MSQAQPIIIQQEAEKGLFSAMKIKLIIIGIAAIGAVGVIVAIVLNYDKISAWAKNKFSILNTSKEKAASAVIQTQENVQKAADNTIKSTTSKIASISTKLKATNQSGVTKIKDKVNTIIAKPKSIDTKVVTQPAKVETPKLTIKPVQTIKNIVSTDKTSTLKSILSSSPTKKISSSGASKSVKSITSKVKKVKLF